MSTKKATKRALLTSILAICMCLVMLIGSTFAWFTDTASTGVNKIQSGTLKVDIVKKDGTTSIKGESMDFVNKDGSNNILWEPGVTFKTTGFKIKNIGNLALKYNLTINGVTGGTEATKLLEVIKFSVVNEEGEAVSLDSFVGTLETKDKTSGLLYIQGHMEETAGNDYQGLDLTGIGITVNATQYTYEKDSINDQYDKDAPLDFVTVSSQAELQDAINAAEPGEDVNLSLTGDVTIADTLYVIGKDVGADVGDVTIQANGKTLTSDKAQATRCLRIEYTDVEREITIIGAKVVSEGTQAGYNANENRGLALYDVKNATINLVNCEIEMKANNYAYAIKMINCENVTLNLTGCTLTGANCIETNGGNGNTINITDCVLNSNYPAGSMPGQGIQDKNGNNNTFNIKNTTFNGTNAQPWESSSNGTTKINDLGGNADNTTITKN